MTRKFVDHRLRLIFVHLVALLSLFAWPTSATAESYFTNFHWQTPAPGRTPALPRHGDKALRLPRETIAGIDMIVTACLDASNQASALNRGRPTFTGTLRTDASGATTYRPTPRNALVVIDASGASTRLEIAMLEGDLTSADDFLYHDHRVACTLSAEPATRLAVASVKAGALREQAIQGEGEADGVPFAVELASSSREVTDVDAGYLTRYADVIEGTLDVEGVRMDVAESAEAESYALRTQTTYTVNSEWREGATRYRFRNLVYTTVLNNGIPEVDSFSAQGAVTANGRTAGQVAVTADRSGVSLNLANNSSQVELNRWE